MPHDAGSRRARRRYQRRRATRLRRVRARHRPPVRHRRLDRLRDAYLGYATRQFRKLLSRDPAWTHRKIAKHARHLMRLVDQGHELYTTGHVTIRLADPDRYRAFGEQVAADPDAARPFMADAEERFATARTALPSEPDLAAAEDWVARVRKAFWEG